LLSEAALIVPRELLAIRTFENTDRFAGGDVEKAIRPQQCRAAVLAVVELP